MMDKHEEFSSFTDDTGSEVWSFRLPEGFDEEVEESEKITLPELKSCAKYCHHMIPIQCFDDDELNMAMYLAGIKEGKRRGKEKFEISAMALAFLMAKWCSLDTMEYLQKKVHMLASSVKDRMSEDDDE
jgi:hypothetical protein